MSQTMHDALVRAARNVRSGALSEGKMSLPSTVPTTTVPSGVAAPSMKAAMINAAKEIRKERNPVHKTTLGDNLSAIGHSFLTGLADVGSSLYEAADFIIPNEAVSQIFGVEDKVEKFFDARRADKATYHAANDRLNAKASPAVAAANNYVVRPVANMLPAAALAVASGGASLAGDAGAAMLGTAGTASAATGTATAVKTATTQLLKNPNFWLSFGQISGNTYSDALENGASEGQAVYTALTNGIAGSLVEMGGGIQKGGQGNWFVNTIEEVGEEVSQGWVENGISAVVYDQDKEWFSLTDPDAVFSATRAKDEAIGTVFAAGVMNAGQMGAVKLNQYVQASRLGSEYLNGTDGKTLQEAIEIGLANAPSMDAYKAAQKIQQKANAGQKVSPYLVGRMVAESFAPEAILARQLDALVANTGEALGVQSETIEAVAAVAVRTGRRVEFATPEQIAAANNVNVASGVGGLYNRDTNTIYVSSALSTDEAVDYVLKHEISHSIETTQAWSKMESLARQAMGEDAYAAAVRDMMAQRQTVGDTTGATETGAKKEVIADWVGKNLWKNNFAAIVAAKDKGLANKLALTMWNVRRGLSFTENGRQTARVKYAEQLLMKAIEDTARTDPALDLNTPSDPSGGQYSLIIKHTDGTTEELADARQLTDEQAVEYLKKAKAGVLQGHSYIPVRKDTPQVIIDTLEQVNESIDNRSLVMQVSKAQQAMRGTGSGRRAKRYGSNIRGHALSAEQIVEIANKLDDPSAVIYQTNRYDLNGKPLPNNVAIFVEYTEGGAEGVAVVEFESSIAPEFIGEDFGDTAYHTVVTVFEPDTERNGFPFDYAEELLSNSNNYELEIKRRLPTRSATRENHPNTSSELSSNTRLSQNDPRVKNNSMQNAPKNSSSGQLSFLPPEMMEQESGYKGKPDFYQGDTSVDREGNTLDEGEQGPKERQFHEKRKRGTDANHSDALVEKVREHNETYTPVSNQETLEKAKEKLRNPEYSRNLQRRILKFNSKDMFNSVDVAAAEVMINDAINDGDIDLAHRLIIGASRKGTELGRAVQAFAMQARLTPEGMLRAARRTTRKTENKMLFDGADEQLDIAAQKVVDTLEQMLKNGNIQPEQVLHILKNLDKVEVPEQISRAIKEAVTRSERKAKVDAAKKDKADSAADAWTLATEITEDAANDGLNDTDIRDYLTDLLGLPRLTNEETAKLIDAASRMQNAEKGSVEWQQAMDEAYTLLASKIPNTKWEVLTEWRKFAMLFNVKTHIRNVSSNLGYQGVRSLDSMNATLLEKLAVRLKLMTPEQRNAQFGWSLTEQGRQLMQSGKLQEAAEAALAEKEHRGQKYGPEQGTLQPYRKYFKPERLEKLRTWNYGLLGKGDNPFFKNAYVNALGQYMVAHGETEISDAGKDFAFERALEAIFAADNWMSDLISEAKRSKIGGAVDVVIPFHKTPANIATQSFYHSPIGLVKGAFDLYGAVKGKNGKTAAEAINTIAKGMTGVALWGIGILLGSFGLFNTGWGKTEKERAADELAGIQENSFQIGNTSITLDWLQPTAAPLIMGASMAQRIREDGLSIGSMFGAVMDGTDSLFELTMLQSLYDILGGYDAGASATVASVAENVVSQSIPTLLGQAARAIDPVQRKTTGDSDFETIVNQVMAKVPGLTYLLEPQLDVWGNEVYRTGKADATGTVLNAFQQAILTMNVKRATGDDEISQLILALYEDQGGRAIPSEPTREKADELGMNYAELAKLVGKVNRQAVEDLTANKVHYTVQRENDYGKKKNVDLHWSDMTDDERARVLSRIYTETKKQVEEPDDDYFEQLIRAVQGG